MSITGQQLQPYVVFLVLIASACQNSPRNLSGFKAATKNKASRFETLQEAPAAVGNFQDGNQDGAGLLGDPFLGAIPIGGPDTLGFPPIATDDDLITDALFGGGPLTAPYARCGDGIRQPLEDCDLGNGGQRPDGSGTYPSGNVGNSNGCNILCGKPVCGNGVTEQNMMCYEECDDGNLEDGDGCSSRCMFERCGNFILDPGEQCDDGNATPNDGCSPCCKYEYCGDDGELCDLVDDDDDDSGAINAEEAL